MRSFTAILPFALLALGLPSKAQEPQTVTPQTTTPQTMTKIVVRLTGSGVRPGSHAALPRTMYVAEPHYARIEDPPDGKLGIHKLVIIAEPDAYNINLIDHKGTHAIDKGAPGDMHLPIVLPFDPKRRLGALDSVQFGDELAGFQAAGAVRSAGPIINAKPTDAYVLKLAGGSATLIVRDETHVPVKLTWSDRDGTHTYEYIEYTSMPFDPALFRKPEGIQIRDMPLDDGATEQG
jgi:hypothetical protein